MPDFDSILNTRAEDIVELPPKPTGTYLAAVAKFPGEPKEVTVQGEQRSILTYQIKLVSPQDDVSQEELAKQPEVASWAPFKYDIWLDDLNVLKRFLVDVLGIEGGGRKIKEMIAESVGRQFLATVEHKPYNDKQTGEPKLAANITKVAKL